MRQPLALVPRRDRSHVDPSGGVTIRQGLGEQEAPVIWYIIDGAVRNRLLDVLPDHTGLRLRGRVVPAGSR
eukprot:15832248-Heterocapsa_arctica.AAC.1